MCVPASAASWKGPFPGSNGQPEVFTLGRDKAPGGTGDDQDVTN